MTEAIDPAIEINRLLASGQEEDVRRGIELVEAGFKAGDPYSIYTIAKWHRLEYAGYKPDRKLERGLLESAARQHVPDALYDMGAIADGPTESKAKRAFKFYVAAALMGDLDAMDAIGNCFEYGNGIDKDKKLAKIIKSYAQGLRKKLEKISPA